jgi:UDP-N-acetylglucosamine 1-carboxyvinyltransferase
MSEYRIKGGLRLKGEVIPSGNKNAALPLIAATLLTNKPVILHNVPRIRDVLALLKLIESLGAITEWIDKNSVRIVAEHVSPTTLDAQLCKAIRASILLAGPTLARTGALTLPPPGGDVIGRRRLDTHFLAMRALGANITMGRDFNLVAKQLTGADIMLDEASVTATENAIMSAVLAKGTTILRNAACEPHVQDLCHCLVKMGARIENIGANILTIHGVASLTGCEFTVGTDNIEVTSFIVLGAVIGNGILIRNAQPADHMMTRIMLGRLGIVFDVRGDDIYVPGGQQLRVVPDLGGAIPKIDDSIWPGFPADAMSLVVVAATQAEGTIMIHEKMFESRLYFVDRLIGMGANIILCDPHRVVVQGKTQLRDDRVQSPDIRAGVALVIAALCADGESFIGNISQIDRGYENFDEKLRNLGAQIERVS